MRYPDWPARLNAFIHEQRGREFEWGTHDCCLFAANAIVAITGEDPAAEVRGHYSTRIGAQRALKRYGNGDVVSTVTAVLGEPAPRLHASRGDIASVDTPDGPALGVVFGTSVLCLTMNGLTSLPISDAIHVWRIE